VRTAASGECVDTSPASAIRCTISVLRKELSRIVLRVHVVNDTEEPVRCTPGTKRDSSALLHADLDLTCEPHAELGFLFAVSRFGRSGRAAFVRICGTSFACAFEAPLDDDGARAAAISLAVAALFVALLAGVVVYERRKRPKPHAKPVEPDSVAAPAPEPAPAPMLPVTSRPPRASEPVRGIETHGFAAVLDEQRVVMGTLECTQRRFFSTDFVAKVVNQASEPLLCTVTGRTRGATVPTSPGSFWIHPQSAVAVAVFAPLRFPWRLRNLQLLMENSSLRASAQADVPIPRAVRLALALAALVVALAIAAVAYRALRPTIQAFAVPARVLAGGTVTANYALSGIGAARYVVSRGGVRVARGTVRIGRGSFTFPTRGRPGTYRVALLATGPFGSAQSSLVLRALGHVTPPRASVDALEVDPGVAASGAPIAVHYVAHAQGGSIALVDAAQIAVVTVPYSANGAAVLAAPRVVAPTQYQVLLRIARGRSTARASVGVLVIPQTLPAPMTPAVAPPMLDAAQLMRVPGRVVAAHRFSVVVLAHPANLRLTLEGRDGTPFTQRSIPSNAAAVEFLAPPATADRRYVIVASFTRGTADQLVLAPLTVYAR
jgi:hypothetical protein